MEDNNVIRILHVVTIMNRGGLETMIMNYYRNIDRNKIQFDFLVHRYEKGSFDDEILSLGGIIYRVPALSFKGYFNYIKQLKLFFLDNSNYKIIHVHNNAFGYFPIKYAKATGINIRIAHSHVALVTEMSIKILIANYFKKQIPKNATNLLACGNDAGKWLFGKNKFSILNNAIDVNKFKYDNLLSLKIRNELHANETINFVSVGRFSPSKNHLFLIDVFFEITKIYPETKLFLVGDGELKTEIEDKIENYNLTNKVIFLGLRDDVNVILQAMDIFLFPSHYEGFPVSLVEAQASGIKCFVSTGVPKNISLVQDLITFVSLKNSAAQWAETIIKNVQYNRLDTSEIIHSEGYDVKVNAEWLTNYYLNLLTLMQ